MTTRSVVRTDEVDRDPYVRLTSEKFKEQVAEGAFIEWVEFVGNYYGTRKLEVEEAMLWENEIPILRLDARGAWKFSVMCREETPPFDRVNMITVMVLPPDRHTLWARLMARDGGDLNTPDIKERMRIVDEYELGFVREMHFAVLNYENEQLKASKTVEEIVRRYYKI